MTDAVPGSSVTMLLHMRTPMEAHDTIVFALQPKGATTDVTWSKTGQYAYLARVIGVVVNMDKMIAGAFDKDLSELKAIAERL